MTAVLLVLLGGFDQRPAVVDRHGGRHLGGRVLARLHRRQHHRHVPFPRRGREDRGRDPRSRTAVRSRAGRGRRRLAPDGPRRRSPARPRSVRASRMSQTAVTRQPSIFRKFSRWPPPWRPTPTMPMRTRGIGGAARRPAGAAAARSRAVAAAATAAVPSFMNSRRSRASVGDIVARCVMRMLSRKRGQRRGIPGPYKETAAGMAAAVEWRLRRDASGRARSPARHRARPPRPPARRR